MPRRDQLSYCDLHKLQPDPTVLKPYKDRILSEGLTSTMESSMY